jgi:hypothetical protein
VVYPGGFRVPYSDSVFLPVSGHKPVNSGKVAAGVHPAIALSCAFPGPAPNPVPLVYTAGYYQNGGDMEKTNRVLDRIDNIKGSILKFVPARCIYLFGSYACGNPTEKSDIDIYVVTPDNINNLWKLKM